MDGAGFPALREWVDLERQALAAAWREALLSRLRQCDAAAPQALRWARTLLDTDPLDETALHHLLQALRAQGHAGEAERQLAAYRSRAGRELGIEPAAALRGGAAESGSDSAPLAPLPAGHRTFVGRRRELAELAQRLTHDPTSGSSTRLHTLIGPGGAGKSRLAREALATLQAPHTWIDLQDLQGPQDPQDLEAVHERLAQRLGVELAPRAPPAMQIARALGHTLGDSARIIVFDNAEHLPALGELAAQLLGAAPRVRLLVTSRRALGIAGENTLALAGLAVPDEESRDVEAAAAFDAVRLFELRARAASPDFTLEPNLEPVLNIVEAVGGLPLAIELAASWVRLLPPQAIAEQLRTAREPLRRDPATRAAPERPEHVSLQTVFDRGWALLAPSERSAMAALAVFAGSFDAEAAAEVAAVPLPMLATLADKSLLAVDEAGRFAVHAVVAQALRTRAAPGDAAANALRDRHAGFYAERLPRWMQAHAADAKMLATRFDAELTDAQQAWRHAISTGRLEWAKGMAPAWRRWFETRGRIEQACAHFRLLADAPAQYADSLPLAHLRATLAHFLVRSNDADAARPLVQQALAVAEAQGDAALARACASTLGGCAMAQGRWDDAAHWFERARRECAAAGDLRGVAACANSLAMVATARGHSSEALVHAHEALNAQQALGQPLGVARCLMTIAQIHTTREDWAAAEDAARRALQQAALHQLPAMAAMAEFWLGLVSLERHDHAAAAKHLERARTRCREAQQPVFEFKAEYHLALLAHRQGDREQGAARLLAAARHAHERGWGEDTLYLGIFLAEALAQAGHAAAARTLLHRVLQAPDEESDAGIRAQARRALEGLGLGPDATSAPFWSAAPSRFDPGRSFADVAACLAMADALPGLAECLVGLPNT
jgi:predicted ATPase